MLNTWKITMMIYQYFKYINRHLLCEISISTTMLIDNYGWIMHSDIVRIVCKHKECYIGKVLKFFSMKTSINDTSFWIFMNMNLHLNETAKIFNFECKSNKNKKSNYLYFYINNNKSFACLFHLEILATYNLILISRLISWHIRYITQNATHYLFRIQCMEWRWHQMNLSRVLIFGKNKKMINVK